MTNQSVEVKLELGHKATLRQKPTAEGFTHDWTVFVRGPENCNIQHFVDKVVFLLHESFPKPRRVIKEPPYQVSESGYAGFIMPVEIYFKNKEEPKKVCFEYDLYLRLEEPVSNIRCEKLTFPNPPEEFRKKLLKAGGIKAKVKDPGSTGVSLTTYTSSKAEHGSSTEQTPSAKPSSKHANKPSGAESHKEKKSKSSSHSSNTSTKQDVAKPPPPPIRPSQPFTDIFGTPIKTRPSQADAPKQKEASVSGKASSGGNKGGKHPPQASSVSSSAKEHKSKESKSSKSSMKRPASPSSGTKRKRTSSSSSAKQAPEADKKPEAAKEGKKHKHGSSQKERPPKPPKAADKPKPSKPHKRSPPEERPPSFSPPSSSGSLSPVASSKNGPLFAMMEEMEKASLSSLSSNPGSPLEFAPASKKKVQPSYSDSESERPLDGGERAFTKEDEEEEETVAHNGDVKKESQQPTTLDPDYLAELVDLQRRIMGLDDRRYLQRIVDVIEETGMYQVTSSTFDFDLCLLDQKTVRKLQGCLAVK